MSNLCSFDMGIQCEEFFAAPGVSKWDQMMDIIDDMGSNDVMDRCEVVSLEEAKASYEMEDTVLEAVDFSDIWDTNTFDEVVDIVQLTSIRRWL